jgi:hypothetical protein
LKIVIYTDDKTIADVIENVVNPVVSDNNVEWEGGSLNGINLPFLLLDDDAAIEEVTDETIALDKKSAHVKVDLAKENADLKARQDLMQSALDDIILGGAL